MKKVVLIYLCLIAGVSCTIGAQSTRPEIGICPISELSGLQLLSGEERIGEGPEFTAAEDLDKLLDELKAARKKNSSTSVMTTIIPKKKFEQILKSRDDIGWTVLTHLIAHGDDVHLKLFFDLIDFYYKHPTAAERKMLSDFILSCDASASVPLFIAIDRKNKRAVAKLLAYQERFVSDRKTHFAVFLPRVVTNAEGVVEKWTPLILAAQVEEPEIMRMILETAARTLGKNSNEFREMIDAHSSYGDTARDIAVPEGVKLLDKYGANNKNRFSKRVV